MSKYPVHDDSTFDTISKKNTRKTRQSLQFSLGQVVVLLSLSASFSAIATALVSVYFLAENVPLIFRHDENLTTYKTSSALRGFPFGMASDESFDSRKSSLFQYGPADSIIKNYGVKDSDSERNVAWLMSFPNSGTSFTIHLTREASNCTTATNYALEGEVKDQPSKPAIIGKAGERGPWLELIPHRTTDIPKTILTKTHCIGFCSGRFCGPAKSIHTVQSFKIGCLAGNQAVQTETGLKLIYVSYDASLVSKAIHIFRHPRDNIVARFHLLFNEKRDAGDTKYVKLFPKNSTGFRRWCAYDDMNRGLIDSDLIDNRIKSFMKIIPCFNEFFRYTQWHNLAFSTTQEMKLPTLVLHYHEYSADLEATRNKILDFLDLPLVGEGIEFHDGKTYRNYYSAEEKRLIRGFLKEFSTSATWNELKDYDFKT